MTVIVIPIIIGTLGTILKSLIKRLDDGEIRGQPVTIQTTALFRLVRILRRVVLLSFRLQWKAIS